MKGGRYIKEANGDLTRVEPVEDPPFVIPAEEVEELEPEQEEDPEQEEEPEQEEDPE